MRLVTKDVPLDHPDFGQAFACPACREGRALRQQRLDVLFTSAGLSKGHLEVTLESFGSLQAWEMAGKETAIAACKAWGGGATAISYDLLGLEDPSGYGDYTRHSLVLHGHPGTGKTTLAAAAFRARLEREGEGLLIEFYDLMNAIQGAYGSGDDKAFRLLEAAQHVALLMLDDLGDPDRGQRDHRASYVRFAETDDRRQKLYNIVNHRCKQDLPTIFTTNLTQAEIRAQFGVSGRILQRLQEMAVFVEVGGASLRPGVPLETQEQGR